MSAWLRASSVPLPMATDTWAWASTGASLTPSPTIATTAPPRLQACDEVVLALRRHAAVRIGYAKCRHGHLPHRFAGSPESRLTRAAEGAQAGAPVSPPPRAIDRPDGSRRASPAHRPVPRTCRLAITVASRIAGGIGKPWPAPAKSGFAQAQSATSDAALDALAGGGLQLMRRHRQLIRRETGRAQRRADGMLRALLQRRRPAQRLVGREISNHHDRQVSRGAAGPRSACRSCRTRNDRRGPGSRWHGRATPAAQAREGAGGHRQRRRRGQRQRAGAAHHQHRDEHPQARRSGVDPVPGDAGGERQQQQGRDEPGGDRGRPAAPRRGFSASARSISRRIGGEPRVPRRPAPRAAPAGCGC
jgi:hypothetical protein